VYRVLTCNTCIEYWLGQYSIQILQVNTLYKYYKSILYTNITSQYSIQVLQVNTLYKYYKSILYTGVLTCNTCIEYWLVILV
jgi:hypothetical protein